MSTLIGGHLECKTYAKQIVFNKLHDDSSPTEINVRKNGNPKMFVLMVYKT